MLEKFCQFSEKCCLDKKCDFLLLVRENEKNIYGRIFAKKVEFVV